MNVINAIALYLIIEITANIAFFLMNKFYKMGKQSGEKLPPWIKGMIERLCLICGLMANYPHVLVAFGALKIGTKLGGQPSSMEDKTTTEYYLIGNLISIMTAIIYCILIDNVTLI